MAKKSMRGNVGAVIAGGIAVAAVAGLWYWWWVWYQDQKKGGETTKYRTAQLVAAPETLGDADDLSVAGADTGGVGFWGDPLSKPEATIGT